jgi:hypothetical protein
MNNRQDPINKTLFHFACVRTGSSVLSQGITMSDTLEGSNWDAQDILGWLPKGIYDTHPTLVTAPKLIWHFGEIWHQNINAGQSPKQIPHLGEIVRHKTNTHSLCCNRSILYLLFKSKFGETSPKRIRPVRHALPSPENKKKKKNRVRCVGTCCSRCAVLEYTCRSSVFFSCSLANNLEKVVGFVDWGQKEIYHG